jgi:hypothetical protein
MPTRTCPHCHVSSRFTRQQSSPYYENVSDQVEAFTAFFEQCDNCGMPLCGIYGPDAEDEGDEVVWPLVAGRIEYPDVPDAIASAAREAHQALAALAPRASVLMARTTIESTARDKGITTRDSLQAKIDRLYADGRISEDMKEAAHEIRFAGNEAAHGDILAESISVEDAQEIVDLMDAILERVYEEPAKVARVRASREARRNSQGAAQ